MSAPEPKSPNPNAHAQPALTPAAAAAPPPAVNREPPDLYHYTSIDWPESLPGPDSSFDDAFRFAQLPSASFLDNILNPVSHPAQPNFLPFGYRQEASPSQRRPHSPVLPYIDIDINRPAMPPSRSRSSRLPNGYVDLTHEPDPTPAPAPATRRKRNSVTPGPSAKRVKPGEGTSASITREPSSPKAKIEEIDLSDDKVSVQEVVQTQRVGAVAAQQKPEEKPITFNSFTCVICMDTPTDITATSCGHLFCHTCLMEALIAGENRSGPNEPKRSQCPVCRKFINRTKATDIIPLLMRKGLATQPRKSSVATSKLPS